MNVAAVDRLAETVRRTAGLLLVVVALAMVATITGRYIGFSTAWADETARIAFVWSACLGAASGLHRGLHFAVNLFGDGGAGTLRRWTGAVTALLMVSLCTVVLWATTASIPVAAKARLPALGLSGAWFHSAIAVFAVLSIVFVSTRLVRSWRTGG